MDRRAVGEIWRGSVTRRGRGRRWRAVAMAAVVVAAGVVAIRPWTSPEAGAEQIGVAGDVVAAADYDGDGRTDRGVFRPANGRWIWVSSASGHAVETPGFGWPGDIPVPADYDGDGVIDRAVYRGSEGKWYLAQSKAGTVVRNWGINGDIPVPGDYDGDGKADLVLYRPGKGTWHLAQSTAGQADRNWGINGDVPVPGDYDGDGKADLVLYRPGKGTWHLAQSTAGQADRNWGINGDIPVPGDYDGDGKADLVLYRPGKGTWHLAQSTAGFAERIWGINGDIPAPGDYNRDGKSDLALYRPGDRNWYIYGIQPKPACSWEWPPGKVFTPGESFVSCSGGRVAFQTDGNLVRYDSAGQAAWASGTAGQAAGGRLEFQASDGNLVIYSRTNQPLWATGVPAQGGVLKYERLGHLAVYNQQDKPVYAQWDQIQKTLDELERQTQDLKRDIDTAQGKAPLADAKYQELKTRLANLERALQAAKAAQANPNAAKQPCTSQAEVGKALVEATAAVVGALGVFATKGDWTIVTFTTTALSASVIDWWEITRKCIEWEEYWRIMNDIRRLQNEMPGIGAYVPPGANGSTTTFANLSLAGLRNGEVSMVIGAAFVVGHPEWLVDYSADPQTPANTVVGIPIEIERDGVPGTLFTMGNGDTIFTPNGPLDLKVLYERDNSTGRSTQTIYDEEGNYVITVDSELGMVNVNDMWNGDNVYGMGVNANIFWGWGMTGFGGWSGGGSGGDGYDGGLCVSKRKGGDKVCLKILPD